MVCGRDADNANVLLFREAHRLGRVGGKGKRYRYASNFLLAFAFLLQIIPDGGDDSVDRRYGVHCPSAAQRCLTRTQLRLINIPIHLPQ